MPFCPKRNSGMQPESNCYWSDTAMDLTLLSGANEETYTNIQSNFYITTSGWSYTATDNGMISVNIYNKTSGNTVWASVNGVKVRGVSNYTGTAQTIVFDVPVKANDVFQLTQNSSSNTKFLVNNIIFISGYTEYKVWKVVSS